MLVLSLCLCLVQSKFNKAIAEAKYLKGRLSRNTTKQGDETTFDFSDQGNQMSQTPGQTPRQSLLGDKQGHLHTLATEGSSSESEEEEMEITLFSGQASNQVSASDEEEEELFH